MSPAPRDLPTMPCDPKRAAPQYTCSDYREEMVVLALRRRLQLPGLTDEEKTDLAEEIARLEKALGF